MEKEIFKREEIKAGYLLCIEDQKDGRKFNMTVVPAKSMDMGPAGLMFATIMTGIKPLTPGDLACANPGKDWCPLSHFDDKLESSTGWRVNAVYGYTTVQHSMDNTIEDRRLLWRRYLPRLLTPAEIEKALGYPVVIIKEGENRKPIGFKKSSMTAGMVVQLRDKATRLVMPSEEGLVLVGDPVPVCGQSVGSMRPVKPLSDYADDLRSMCKDDSSSDIVQVWSRIQHRGHIDDAFTTRTVYRKKLWERDEVKRMTMKEIEEALDYPVVLVEAGRVVSGSMDGRTVYAVDEAGRAAASAWV